MVAWADWYVNAIDAMVSLRGPGAAKDFRGVSLPLMNPLDSIAVLAQLPGGVIHAITNVSEGKTGKMIVCSRVDADGLVQADVATWAELGSQTGADFIDAAHYVAGGGNPGAPWQRSAGMVGKLESLVGSPRLFEPWLLDTGHASVDELSFGRQMMAAWQKSTNACAVMIQTGSANLTDAANASAVALFWNAIFNLCSSLDTMNEHPPPTETQKIKQGFSDAYHAVGDLADQAAGAAGDLLGRAAAKMGQLAGEVGGGAAQGFIMQAGVLSFVVAGIAVWWHFH